MTRPRPVMACAECGPVFTEYVTECRFCPGLEGHEVYWYDLPTGLDFEADVSDDRRQIRLLTDAANLIRAQQDTIEAMQQAPGGAKRRRQEEKVRRLAEVIREQGYTMQDMTDLRWTCARLIVNRRYANDPIGPPSDETKALVAAMFAEPQEAKSQ